MNHSIVTAKEGLYKVKNEGLVYVGFALEYWSQIKKIKEQK